MNFFISTSRHFAIRLLNCKVFILSILMLTSAGAAFSQTPPPDVIQGMVDAGIQNELEGMFPGIFDTLKPTVGWLPDTNAQANIQPEAYIGRFFDGGTAVPRWPVHFTFGETVGFGSDGVMADLGDTLGILIGTGGGTLTGMPLIPLFAADMRIGGFYLPFDVGITFIDFHTDAVSLLGGPMGGLGFSSISNVFVDLTSLGVDFRYRILEDGWGLGILTNKNHPEPVKPFWKQPRFYAEGSFWRRFIPGLSIGGGYNRYHMGMDIVGVVNGAGGAADVRANLGFDVESAYGSVQLSKKIYFLVPYIGFRFGVSRNRVSVDVKAETVQFQQGDVYIGRAAISDHLEEAWHNSSVLFAGLGINAGILQIGFNMSYNLANDIKDAEGFGLMFRLKF
jgi:hypothetical protein